MTKLKFHLKKTLYLDDLLVLKTKNPSALKIWPASTGKRQIKVDFMKFSLSCSCPKSCTFHKPFKGPKIATEALLLTKLKFHLKKTLYLDDLLVLKTKNPSFRKSLGHPGVQSSIL